MISKDSIEETLKQLVIENIYLNIGEKITQEVINIYKKEKTKIIGEVKEGLINNLIEKIERLENGSGY